MTTLNIREALYRVADSVAKHEAGPHPLTESALRRLCGEAVVGDFDTAVDAILDAPGSDADHVAALSALTASNVAVMNTVIDALIPNPHEAFGGITAAKVRALADRTA